jgi:hypothetical protein
MSVSFVVREFPSFLKNWKPTLTLWKYSQENNLSLSSDITLDYYIIGMVLLIILALCAKNQVKTIMIIKIVINPPRVVRN